MTNRSRYEEPVDRGVLEMRLVVTAPDYEAALDCWPTALGGRSTVEQFLRDVRARLER